MSAISAICPSRPQGPSRGAAKGNPLALIAAAIGTLLLTLAFIAVAPLTAAAQPEEGSTASYMGYTHHDPETKIRTLHINEHSAGLAPTRDNLVYCFNSKLLFPPAERNDYSWKRHYDTDLTHFASYKRSDLNEKVLAVMYSGYSSNPKRIENRANLGLHNDAEFYAATQMAIWILTDYKHVDDSAWKNAFGERMPDIKKAAQRLVSSSAKAPENAKLEIYAPDDSSFQNLLGINFIQKDSGEKFYAPISGSIDTLTTGGETVETTVEDSATESTGSSAAEEIEDTSTDTAVRGSYNADQTIETVEEEEKVEAPESADSHVVEYSEDTSSSESVQSNLVEHSEDTATHSEVRGAYSSDQAIEHTEDTNVATGSRDTQDTSKTTEPTESQDVKKVDKDEKDRESVKTRVSTQAPKSGDSKPEREKKTEIVEKSEKREKTVKTTEPAPKTSTSSSASATTTISAPTPATATTAPATTTAPEAHSAATSKSAKTEAAKSSTSTTTTTATTAPSRTESKSESKQSTAAEATSKGTLAQTGVEAWALIGFAALAIAGGVLLVWTKKRES